jgi:PAS domain S-box-containing protein
MSKPRIQTESAAFERKVAGLRGRLEAHAGRSDWTLDEVRHRLEELQVQHETLVAAGQELEQEHQRYREVFDFAPDGYLTTDALGVIQEANRSAGDQLGVPPDGLRHLPLAVFVAPGDRAAFRTHLNRLGDPRAQPEWELTLVPKQGAPFPAALTVSPILAPEPARGARPPGFRWLLRSITTRKQTEAALQQAADFPDENASPVLCVTRDGVLLYANRGSAPLLTLWVCRVGERLPAAWCTRVANAYATGQTAEVDVVCTDTIYAWRLQPIAGRDSAAVEANTLGRRP